MKVHYTHGEELLSATKEHDEILCNEFGAKLDMWQVERIYGIAEVKFTPEDVAKE